MITTVVIVSSFACVFTTCSYVRSMWFNRYPLQPIELNSLPCTMSFGCRYRIAWVGIGWDWYSVERPPHAWPDVSHQEWTVIDAFGVHLSATRSEYQISAHITPVSAFSFGLTMPSLLLIFLTSLPATALLTAMVRTYRRRLRMKKGQCSRCGYDLRASRDKCPECGTPIPSTISAPAETRAEQEDGKKPITYY